MGSAQALRRVYNCVEQACNACLMFKKLGPTPTAREVRVTWCALVADFQLQCVLKIRQSCYLLQYIFAFATLTQYPSADVLLVIQLSSS